MGKNKQVVSKAIEVPPAPTGDDAIDVNSFIQELFLCSVWKRANN